MDIVRVIKSFHLKGSFETLRLKHKFFLILFLFSFITNLVPHEVSAAFLITQNYQPGLVFDISSNNYQDYLAQVSQDATDRYYLLQLEANAQLQAALTEKLQSYLEAQNSPLAPYANTLVAQRNWKKIVALANAESSLCRNYPVNKANCWGVGGTTLWNMGNSLDQGIVAMNQFLDQYPKGPVKYSDMSFTDMNGLYKQPAAQHWVNNAESTYQDMLNIQNSVL